MNSERNFESKLSEGLVSTSGYVYLIQSSKHKWSDIYKIGKTKYENQKRFRGYPKGSIGYSMSIVNDYNNCEKDLILEFKKHFVLQKGYEYFKGDIDLMKDIYNKLVNSDKYKYIEDKKNIYGDNIDEKYEWIRLVDGVYNTYRKDSDFIKLKNKLNKDMNDGKELTDRDMNTFEILLYIDNIETVYSSEHEGTDNIENLKINPFYLILT